MGYILCPKPGTTEFKETFTLLGTDTEFQLLNMFMFMPQHIKKEILPSLVSIYIFGVFNRIRQG